MVPSYPSSFKISTFSTISIARLFKSLILSERGYKVFVVGPI